MLLVRLSRLLQLLLHSVDLGGHPIQISLVLGAQLGAVLLRLPYFGVQILLALSQIANLFLELFLVFADYALLVRDPRLVLNLNLAVLFVLDLGRRFAWRRK